MAITSVEQGVLNTSLGDYYIPIIHVDFAVKDGIHQFIFTNQLINIRCSLVRSYVNNSYVCTPFETATFTFESFQTSNAKMTVKASGNTYTSGELDPGEYAPLAIGIVVGSDDYKRVIGLGSGNDYPSEALIITSVNTPTSFGEVRIREAWWFYTLNGEASEEELAVINSIKPAYTWASWDRIAGNSGQYSATMTQIKDSVISDADPAAYKVLEAGDFDLISPTSSIWNTYLNALLGEEYTIAWSGNNKATLTVTNHATDPGIKIFTFKFYLGATLAPFLTAQEEVIVGGETPGLIAHNYYLTFLYDAENEVAAFYPVRYMPNGELVKYAHQIFPALSDVTMQNLYTWLMASENAPEGSGPYDTGTTDNGGTPTGGGHQDPMPTIHVPVLSGGASGMFTIYCPTEAQLGDIADFLWSDNVLDNFKKYFNNFSDNIIALYVLPYKPANLPTKAFKVGKMQSQDITDVEYVTTRFVSIPMGEITVGTRWDSYLDFEPYTKFNIYLPGIGVQALSADDIICPPNMDESMPIAKGSKISLEYVLDLMTGNVAAYVKINGQIRYQFTGKVGYSIPITGANYNSMVQGYVMATAGLIGTLATGGTAAPFAASAGAAGIINAMKPDVYRGGNLSGDSSSMCLEYPYLIRRRPNKPYLEDQEEFTGFPSYKTGNLSEFSGYTEVIDAHIEGISCTEEERDIILAALKGGVIL